MAVRFRSDFYSRYMWHGIPFSQGAVWQPSATVEYHGVGFNVWTNFVLSEDPNQGEFNEVDFTLYYGRTVRKLDIQFSLLGSVFINEEPGSLNTGPNSFESILALSHPLGPISLFTNLNVGFLNPGGTIFWDFGVSFHHDLPLHFSLETSILFGLGDSRFNRAYFGVDGTKANLLECSLAFPWEPIKRLSITPSMTVSTLLTTALRSAAADPTIVWGGLSIAYDI